MSAFKQENFEQEITERTEMKIPLSPSPLPPLSPVQKSAIRNPQFPGGCQGIPRHKDKVFPDLPKPVIVTKITNVAAKNQIGRRMSGLWKIAGAIPVGAFLALTGILVGRASGAGIESPLLVAFLNTLFLVGILLVVAYMAARSYQRTGSLTFLMMGCGALFRGVSILITSWLIPETGNPNLKLTLYDPCCMLAGVCHFMSAYYLLADLLGKNATERRFRHLALPYAGVVVFVCVAAALAVEGMLPVFFVPGAGPSLLRQFFVVAGLCLFAFSGLMFLGIYFATKTEFAYWYGLALLTVAAGLVSIIYLKTMWDTLRWVGRFVQYLGSVYFLFALLAGRREMGQASGSAAAASRWGLWPYLEQKVNERTLALEKANQDLQMEIVERRWAEQALRCSETKFRTLYDLTSDAVMLLDENGFFDCNPAALAIFGCATREEFCSNHPGDLSPPLQPDGTDSRTLANRQIATALEKGSNHFEWIHKRANTGEVFAADVMLSAMELDGKRVLQATVRDISERKRAQEAVSKAEAMQRTIFDSTDDFIWTVDPNALAC